MKTKLNSLALDLWELAADLGEQIPITPHRYVAHFGRDKQESAVLRTWQRLLRRVRNSPFPADIVWDTADETGRPVMALILPKGTKAETARILDYQAARQRRPRDDDE